MSDELANGRTYLAWLRTGIALFGLGFVVAKVALIIQPDTKGLSGKGLYSGGGVLIVLSGAALIVVGYFQHAGVLNVLKHEDEARRAMVAVDDHGSSGCRLAPPLRPDRRVDVGPLRTSSTATRALPRLRLAGTPR